MCPVLQLTRSTVQGSPSSMQKISSHQRMVLTWPLNAEHLRSPFPGCLRSDGRNGGIADCWEPSGGRPHRMPRRAPDSARCRTQRIRCAAVLRGQGQAQEELEGHVVVHREIEHEHERPRREGTCSHSTAWRHVAPVAPCVGPGQSPTVMARTGLHVTCMALTALHARATASQLASLLTS
jgi:hypothetical protein